MPNATWAGILCVLRLKFESYDILRPFELFRLRTPFCHIFCLTSLKADLPRVIPCHGESWLSTTPNVFPQKDGCNGRDLKQTKSPDSDDKKGGKFWKDMERYATDPHQLAKKMQTCKKSLQSGPKWNGQQRRHEDTTCLLLYFFCFLLFFFCMR